MSGIEGHVDMSFTIDKNGFVRDAEVIDKKSTRGDRTASLSRKKARVLEEAALDAVKRFRYAPKFVDGKVVETDNVKTRITFAIE